VVGLPVHAIYLHGEPHLLVSVDDITISKQAEVNLELYAARLEQSNRDLQEFAYIASQICRNLAKVLAFGDRLTKNMGTCSMIRCRY
jgi:hypothetical protein